MHFYKIISLKDLIQLIKENKNLLGKGTNIFIQKSIEKIDAVSFDNEILKEYCKNDKVMNGNSNELVFESIRDLQDPTKEYFPFLFYSKID